MKAGERTWRVGQGAGGKDPHAVYTQTTNTSIAIPL